MTTDESNELLDRRWNAVIATVADNRGDPATDLWRDGLRVRVRIWSRARPDTDGQPKRDLYVFGLDFTDYDAHAPRIWLCDPSDSTTVGVGRQFYPRIEGNGVFNHDNFFCMPGDRRCYEQGNHHEWKLTQHYHPDIVLTSLFALIHSPQYQGRLA